MEDARAESVTVQEPLDIIEAELAGCLVLLVEDNETNQLVMSMQISTLGYTAIITSDGHEALELWERHSFALVLTDCSMPEMDGFELASAIRQAESSTGIHTPIVAVTANADNSEITRCLNCGMDDCIFKPVDLDALRSVLEQWLSQPDSHALITRTETVASDRSEIRHASTPVDPEVLNSLFEGDTAMHHRLLLKYRDTSPAIFNTMDRAVEEGDLASVVAAAHKIKSSTRTIGAVQLADLIQLMEDAGKLNESGKVTRLASLIREEFDRVVHYINQLS